MIDEYQGLGIVVLSVSMWTIVSPYFPFFAWLILHFRFRFDIPRLFKLSRRPIPRAVYGADPTGGYMKWYHTLSQWVTKYRIPLESANI